jgi:hypothetical protein
MLSIGEKEDGVGACPVSTATININEYLGLLDFIIIMRRNT